MLRGNRVTAVIPARGGSKGIPKKNLYRLGSDTLLERSIKIALLCDRVDQVIVSTDDPEMFNIATTLEVASCGLRPAHLSGDTASTVDVVLDLIEGGHIEVGWVLLLQVTSPLRTLGDLEHFLDAFEDSKTKFDAAASVVKFDSPHPDKIQKIENGCLKSYSGRESMVARQLLPLVYALNGAFYINHTESITKMKTFLPERTSAFEMPPQKSLNLDSPNDLILLEALIERGMVSLEEY